VTTTILGFRIKITIKINGIIEKDNIKFMGRNAKLDDETLRGTW